jgi:hypothetical protein
VLRVPCTTTWQALWQRLLVDGMRYGKNHGVALPGKRSNSERFLNVVTSPGVTEMYRGIR